MFDNLTERLTGTLNKIRSRGRLTEQDVDAAMREVRMALLEADVNFKVARDFIAEVRAKSVGAGVLEGINPGHQVVKIVHDELVRFLTGESHTLNAGPTSPSVLMLCGLQGSGKTTTAAKLALLLRKQGHQSLLVAADLKRPAAVEQVRQLGKQLDIPVYDEGTTSKPVAVARNGVKKGRELGVRWVIVDTGGRLHIDEELMEELREIREAVQPNEVVLVVDAMTGQDAVRVAQDFHSRVQLTGLIMSKMDGDARGGAALSVTHVTGVPIKFVGMGEKPDALEPFHPDRIASRILGMGDVMTLIERVQANVDEERAKELEAKLRKAKFDLEDFLEQLRMIRRMGPLQQIMEMLPGFNQMKGQLPAEALDEKRLRTIEAIVLSMTPRERHNPDIIDMSRRRRIARGSGVKPEEVGSLLNQFRQAQQMMKKMAGMKKPPRNLMRMMK